MAAAMMPGFFTRLKSSAAGAWLWLRYAAILLPGLPLLGACAVYQNYGFGKIVKSRLDPSLATPVELPSAAPTISQRFRPLKFGTGIEHKGFDILVPSRTPVLAAGDGMVARVDLSMLYGRQVIVNHGRSSEGYRLQTRYFHLSEKLVRAGEVVARGQLLGYSGASGLAGLYPHLHFEVHRLSDAEPAISVGIVDPQHYWVEGVGKVTCFDRTREFVPHPIRLTYPVPCQNLAWE